MNYGKTPATKRGETNGAKGHYWHCLDTGQAGNASDFLKVRRGLGEGGFARIRGVTFNEAMTLLMAAAPPVAP